MFKELSESYKARFGQGSATQSLGDWICTNTTLDRRPFTFKKFGFQKAIADDDHPNLACEKLSQVGLTEIQIRKFFAILRRGTSLSGIFTLPNEKMFKRIYTGRMKPLLDTNEIFNPPSEIKPVRRMDLVQIGDSYGYITGCTEGDATSISADFLMHDEFDLSPMDMIGLFQSRLQSSDMKMTQAFSTPTYIDFGINKSLKMSDQREYLCKCASCNHVQIPDFTLRFVKIPNLHFDIGELTDLTSEQIASLDLTGATVVCERCHRPLDLNHGREWVAKFPSRTNFRGYKVRPFSTTQITVPYILTQLAKYLDKDNLRGFHNTVLGNPFTESSAQIQESDIRKCFVSNGEAPNIGDTPVFLGIDVGISCHISIVGDTDNEGRDPWFYFETIPALMLEQRINDLFQIYNVVQGCIDRLPYTTDAERIRDKTGMRVVPVQYGGRMALTMHKDEFDVFSYYTANRTSALDKVRDSIAKHKAVIAGYGPYKETLVAHLRDMVRVEKPEAEPEWTKINGTDHFFHSMALALLARRVCEHMHTKEMLTELTTILVSGAQISKPADLNHNRGAARVARLGGR